MIYLPIFSDQRVIDFCGTNGSTVDGFYKTLGDLGFTGSIDDRWKAYLMDKYGYFSGMHINAYEPEESFAFMEYTAPVIYTISSNADSIWGDIWDGEDPGSFDFPATTELNVGTVIHSAIALTGSEGAADKFTFMRFSSVASITEEITSANISVGITTWVGTAAPTLRVRAIKDGSAVTWGATGTTELVPLGYTSPGWTEAYTDWTPTYGATGRYDIDVTDIINELIVLGNFDGNVIFVLESIDALDLVNRSFRMGGLTNYLNQLALIVYPTSSLRFNQVVSIPNGSLVFYHPHDSGDMATIDTAGYRNIGSTVAGGKPVAYTVPRADMHINQTAFPRRYAATIVTGGAEFDAEAPLPDQGRHWVTNRTNSGSYYWLLNSLTKSYLLFKQTSHVVGTNPNMLFDGYGGVYGWEMGIQETGGASIGPYDAPTTIALPNTVRNTVDEIHTMALYYDATTDTAYVGNNGGSGETLTWTAGASVTGATANQSGYAVGGGGVRTQGECLIEFTTTPALADVKAACDQMRKYWRFGVKQIAPLFL